MFKVNTNFDAKKFRKSIEKATEESATEHYRKVMRGIVCPIHGTSPTVTPKGSIATKMSWSINACCDEQMKIVHARMGVEESSNDILGGGPSVKDLLRTPSVKDALRG